MSSNRKRASAASNVPADLPPAAERKKRAVVHRAEDADDGELYVCMCRHGVSLAPCHNREFVFYVDVSH